MERKLNFILKYKWFDKILCGDKTTEYRENKLFWKTRLKNSPEMIVFRRGYTKNAPVIYAKIISVDIIDGVTSDLNIQKEVFAIKFEIINSKEGL